MEKGFSMVELMVVLTIVLVVSALGLSQFSQYKKRANDIKAVTDIKSIVGEMYKYFEDNSTYSEDQLPTPRISEGVNYKIELTGVGQNDFIAYTWHTNGTKTWCYTYDGEGKELGRKGLNSNPELGKACNDGHSLN